MCLFYSFVFEGFFLFFQSKGLYTYTILFYSKCSHLQRPFYCTRWISDIHFFGPSLIFSDEKKKVGPIKSLHLAKSVLIAQNAHQYTEYALIWKKTLFDLRHTTACYAGSIGSLKCFLCLLRCGSKTANENSNCKLPHWHPASTSTPGSNYETLLAAAFS